jgi:hypothetical protein
VISVPAVSVTLGVLMAVVTFMPFVIARFIVTEQSPEGLRTDDHHRGKAERNRRRALRNGGVNNWRRAGSGCSHHDPWERQAGQTHTDPEGHAGMGGGDKSRANRDCGQTEEDFCSFHSCVI